MSSVEPASGEKGKRPVIADHQLIRRIGAGSGGEVWLAQNTLGSYRAVKIIYRNEFATQNTFESELEGIMKFEPLSRQHDGLVDVLHIGRHERSDYFYYVMELADDIHTAQNIHPDFYQPRTLAHDLTARHRLPIGECIRAGAPIASALGFLHRHGLIHRDVKPANIIFVNGFPKLVDAGLVTDMFKSRSRVGTEGFIAPEGPGTARADIYGLGKVLYEISTGKDRNSYPELPADLATLRDAGDIVRFNKIILNACLPNPRLRYRDAEEMMSALLAFQFSPRSPFEEKVHRFSISLIGWIGLLVAVVVIVLMVNRIIALFQHSS